MSARSIVGFIVLLTLATGCDQNVTRVSGGERLEDAAPIEADPAAKAPAGAAEDGTGEFSEEVVRERMAGVPPFLKVYFMHQFVEALYSVPKNRHPNPDWESPLKDPANGRVWCTDCHADTFDFAKMPKQRFPQIDALEQDREFMIELMTKWVGRLNSDEFRASAKLKEPVVCVTCHATDPREE